MASVPLLQLLTIVVKDVVWLFVVEGLLRGLFVEHVSGGLSLLVDVTVDIH